MGQQQRTRATMKRTSVLALGLVGVLTASGLVAMVATSSPASAAAPQQAVQITPFADTYVSAQNPTTNYGKRQYMDVDGSTQNSCSAPNLQNYALMKFQIPAPTLGAVVTGARLRVTSRAGYTSGVDPNFYLLRVSNTLWNEDTVTWNTFQSGINPIPSLPPGMDVRKTVALGSASMVRPCGSSTDQVSVFPSNGINGTVDTNMDLATAQSNLVAAVNDARTNGGGVLGLELFAPDSASGSSWGRFNTSDNSDPNLRPTLILTYGSVDIIRAATNTSNTSTSLAVRVDGSPSTQYTVNVLTGSSCLNGQLVSPTSSIGNFSVVTSAAGDPIPGEVYATGTVGASSGYIGVYLTTGTGEQTTTFGCVAAGPSSDNDSWPRAADVALQNDVNGPSGTATGKVDRSGTSRWYKFPIQPGGKVRVDLTTLPVDLDLAVFTDIATAYNKLTSNKDLTQLSAEFAPSVFSPSVFSPSVFSPDDYAPSVFSPSVFSPSVFSPDAFSPSVFSPSVFSPSVFSPSVFSPSVFSPSVFSPSVFSSADFASAQTRSLIGVSYSTGSGDELVIANTWSNTGNFYVRVAGRNGAFSPTPFSLNVKRDDLGACTGVGAQGSAPAPQIAGTVQSVLLVDSARMRTQGSTDLQVNALISKLSTFASRPEVRGVVVDVSTDPRVNALNVQADGSSASGCPYAKNLVAGAIKDIVASYRVANPVKYVVLVGPDAAIPFFRYPDDTLLGPESDYVPPVKSDSASEANLRLNYVLGQDEYGSSTTLDLGNGAFPIPDLAVGRLVETADEASGMIDAYTGGSTNSANGVLTPTKSLVTGYDFLQDAADEVNTQLSAGIGVNSDTLISPNNTSPAAGWTASQLRTKLLGTTRNDITFLAGHFSANSALAADFSTAVLSTELNNSATDFKNTVVFSAGCHSGYNIVDSDAVPSVTVKMDWAQAFARKQATLIAGTGYQYGDTDFLEYSERIYTDFAKQLRYGSGPVAVGDALVRSKQTYLQGTPDIRGIHRKALLESALFGLPMFSVNMPNRTVSPPVSPVVGNPVTATVNPGAALGLSVVDFPLDTTGTQKKDVPLTITGGGSVMARYYTGPHGQTTNPGEPTLPIFSIDATKANRVLRGIGFRGGNYIDESGVTPLTGAAATELGSPHIPFESPVFFPMRMATANYFDALKPGGGMQKILVTPVQYQGNPVDDKATERKFSKLDIRLYYSAFTAGQESAALSDAPAITNIAAVDNGTGTVAFRANVTGNPAAGVHEVWVTYTTSNDVWSPVDLVQCSRPLRSPCTAEDSTVWMGAASGVAVPSALRFIVQAANGVGLVTFDDAVGEFHRIGGPANAGAATTLSFVPTPPSAGPYGSVASVSASLSAGAGLPVYFRIGGSSFVAGITGANGVATASVPIKSLPGNFSLTALFPGTATLRSSSVSTPFVVSKSPTQLAITVTAQTATVAGKAVAKLTANGKPLAYKTVFLLVSRNGAPATVLPVITDYRGEAPFIPSGPGSYSVTAMFLGNIPGVGTYTDLTYLASSAVGQLVVQPVADLALSGSVAPSPAEVAKPLTYTFTLVNSGPEAATNVVITTTVPASFVVSTPSAGCTTAAAGAVTCPTVVSGAAMTVLATGSPTVGTLGLAATASVTADSLDTVPGNNAVTLSAPVYQAPSGLTVTGPSSVLAGSTYSATSALASAGFPSNVTFTKVPVAGAPSWLTVDAVTGAVTAPVPVTGVITFSYQVQATNPLNPLLLTKSPVITVTVTPVPDLAIAAKAPGLFIGNPTTYSLIVSNKSAFAQPGKVTVTLQLPSTLTLAAGSPGAGWEPCTVNVTNLVSCDRVGLAANSSVGLAINVNVFALVGTTVSVTATVLPPDSVPSNNTVTITQTVKRI